MASEVIQLLSDSITAAGAWFTAIIESTGMETVYIVYLFIFLSFSIILMPLLGGRSLPLLNLFSGSDRASRRSGRSDREDDHS